MVIPLNKRASMTMYSGDDAYSHRVRMVLEEKRIACDVLNIFSSMKLQQELAECNPYHSVPTLTDRDLVLYQSEIIMEYLDERFPHPPLMPAYPIARARSRMMIHRVNQDWYRIMDRILSNPPTDQLRAARKELRDSLVSVTPVFNEMAYFLSEEFSLVDCCIAPLLWRLPLLGVELPSEAKPVMDYARRLFAREAFQRSLTDSERAIQT